jgi:hypothetical protein
MLLPAGVAAQAPENAAHTTGDQSRPAYMTTLLQQQ